MINIKYAVYCPHLIKAKCRQKMHSKISRKKIKIHLSKNWVTYAHSSTNQVEDVKIFVLYIFGQR